MIRRTSNSKADNPQLGLPFGGASPTGKPQVMEPIAVRILEAVRLTGIGRSKLYEPLLPKLGRRIVAPSRSWSR